MLEDVKKEMSEEQNSDFDGVREWLVESDIDEFGESKEDFVERAKRLAREKEEKGRGKVVEKEQALEQVLEKEPSRELSHEEWAPKGQQDRAGSRMGIAFRSRFDFDVTRSYSRSIPTHRIRLSSSPSSRFATQSPSFLFLGQPLGWSGTTLGSQPEALHRTQRPNGELWSSRVLYSARHLSLALFASSWLTLVVVAEYPPPAYPSQSAAEARRCRKSKCLPTPPSFWTRRRSR